MDTKQIIVGIVGFLVGVSLTSIISLKIIMENYHEFLIGKLGDNVTFYRQIESGHPERVLMAVKSSMEFFINMTDDFQTSLWVTPNQTAKKVLQQAKELQQELESKHISSNNNSQNPAIK